MRNCNKRKTVTNGEEKTMKRKVTAGILAMTVLLSCMAGCGSKNSDSKNAVVKLDPDNPISLMVWHYYNGMQQTTFDQLVEEFNATEGKDQGIYVEERSLGSVGDLEEAITASLNGEVGSDSMPDIFSTYADTAYAVHKQGKLADLSEYFCKEEQEAYVDSYIEEGHLDGDDALYMLPVAKSTEVLMLNKTDWEPFAQATGTTLDELATTEGIAAVAEKYYNWTDSLTPDIPNDGKAFYGRDSMSNYFVIGMKQMGQDMFSVKDGKIVANTDKELIHRLWENYYVSYVKGYFDAYGKFRSDDVKTGNIVAYTGSTASVFYFPDDVESEAESYPIDYQVLSAPVMEGGDNYRVQQGAGMAVTKSDEGHEYAASVFLKWFTQKEQNLRFVSASSYLPVLKEANNMEALDKVIKEDQIEIDDKTYSCLNSVLNEFDQIRFYTSPTGEDGYSKRKVLDYNLSDQAKADRDAIQNAIAAGADREEELAKYTSEASFENWYQGFCAALNAQ